MSKESMMIVKNGIEQLRIKKQQLLALQTKEADENEKISKFNKLLEQAMIDHEACMRSNLVGNASDKNLDESKSNLKELADSLQEAKEKLQLISDTRAKLNSEVSTLNGDLTVHRSILCAKLAKDTHDEMVANKKINEKLVVGYAAFLASGDHDTSWTRFLLLNYPLPSEHEMNLAVEKFRANNEFMRD